MTQSNINHSNSVVNVDRIDVQQHDEVRSESTLEVLKEINASISSIKLTVPKIKHEINVPEAPPAPVIVEPPRAEIRVESRVKKPHLFLISLEVLAIITGVAYYILKTEGVL